MLFKIKCCLKILSVDGCNLLKLCQLCCKIKPVLTKHNERLFSDISMLCVICVIRKDIYTIFFYPKNKLYAFKLVLNKLFLE